MRFILNNLYGSATLLSIFMATVVITVGLGFNWLIKEHLKASEALRDKAEAVLKARSAYDMLIFFILNGQVLPNEIISITEYETFKVKRLPLNGAKIFISDDVTVQAQDSNGLLSLSNLNKEALERLIKNVGRTEEALAIINSYLDWIDPDSFVRVNGAEDFYYRSEGVPYGPRNYPLQFKEEFEWIRGVGKELYKKIEPHLTLLPSLGFNPNTAHDEVLMAYLDISDDALKTLKDFMAQKVITSDSELYTLIGRKIASEHEGVYFFPSPFLEITISVGKERSLYTIRFGLDIRQNLNSPYSILYWKEE